MAVRYAENLMLFKSAAGTQENPSESTAQQPYLPGREQQLQLPDPSPSSRSRE